MRDWYKKLVFISLNDAAEIADNSVRRADDCDWNVYAPHLDLGTLYIANAFILNTIKKQGQPALEALTFYHCDKYVGGRITMTPIKSFSGRAEWNGWHDGEKWITRMCLRQGYNKYFNIYVNRWELWRWIRTASKWNYLALYKKTTVTHEN